MATADEPTATTTRKRQAEVQLINNSPRQTDPQNNSKTTAIELTSASTTTNVEPIDANATTHPVIHL